MGLLTRAVLLGDEEAAGECAAADEALQVFATELDSASSSEMAGRFPCGYSAADCSSMRPTSIEAERDHDVEAGRGRRDHAWPNGG